MKIGAGSRTTAHCEIIGNSYMKLHSVPRAHYEVECWTSSGGLRWSESCRNIVVNQGLDHLLSVITTTAHVSGWFVGVMTTGFTGLAATDTATGSAVNNNLSSAFSNATLPAFTAGSISGQSVDNSASKAAFNINAATSLGGAILVNSNVKAGPTEGAILYGGATFSAERAVQNGDTLNVTVTISTEVT